MSERLRFLDKVAALGRERQIFATATVVGRRPPVSARLGDRALIYGDGRMEGFVGGACSREIVRTQALEALAARQPRMVSIRPDAAGSSSESPDHVVVPMSCASEGAVDVYIEPFVQARRLVVVGSTPVAEAVARLGSLLEYDVVRVVDAAEQRDVEALASGVPVAPLAALADVLRGGGGHVAAVVASQGHYDEDALTSILASQPAYVGLVASRKRGDTVRTILREGGVIGGDSVRIPAGLNLGGETPTEIALSILAEIVQTRQAARSAAVSAPAAADAVAVNPATSRDPVCGMEVTIANARHTAEVDGTVYYFCCANCRARFIKNPAQFLTVAG